MCLPFLCGGRHDTGREKPATPPPPSHPAHHADTRYPNQPIVAPSPVEGAHRHGHGYGAGKNFGADDAAGRGRAPGVIMNREPGPAFFNNNSDSDGVFDRGREGAAENIAAPAPAPPQTSGSPWKRGTNMVASTLAPQSPERKERVADKSANAASDHSRWR